MQDSGFETGIGHHFPSEKSHRWLCSGQCCVKAVSCLVLVPKIPAALLFFGGINRIVSRQRTRIHAMYGKLGYRLPADDL